MGVPQPAELEATFNEAFERLAVREARRVRRLPPGGDYKSTPDRADDVVVGVDLARALQGLSRRQRQAIALRYLADLSDVAGASLMGCSVPSFRTHCSRGLVALKAQLGPTPDGVSEQQDRYTT